MKFEGFRVRRLDFSLKYREIRPSAVIGTRRKAALRREAYAWKPDLRSLDKLREVGVSPYLGFILYLSTLLMFELNEVVRGRLISPKSWDRIVIIFETSNGQPVQSMDCLCCICWKICIKWCFGMYMAGNGRKIRVH